MADLPPVPFDRSWWIDPGKLLGGPYPGSPDPEDAARKLAALVDAGSSEVDEPATMAVEKDGAWCLRGAKGLVPAAERAARILVPAATPGGVGIFLVDPAAPGCEIVSSVSTTGVSR